MTPSFSYHCLKAIFIKKLLKIGTASIKALILIYVLVFKEEKQKIYSKIKNISNFLSNNKTIILHPFSKSTINFSNNSNHLTSNHSFKNKIFPQISNQITSTILTIKIDKILDTLQLSHTPSFSSTLQNKNNQESSNSSNKSSH